MKLGPFEVDHPFILAPMAGITTSPFRRLMRQKQSAIVISDLISANGLAHGSQKTEEMFNFHDDERVLGIQIFSEDEKNLVGACQYAERKGADFVDLNLGCPVPKIVKKGAGSAMCKDPVSLGKILTAMVKSVKIPVTIKIRTGWDANSRNAHDVVRAAADAGVTWVAVHGRTRAQGYSGAADWDFISEIKEKSPIPIIGNGDINTAEVAVKAYQKYGVDGVMIGRGALRNPFIFEQSKAVLDGETFERPTADEYLGLVEKQLDFLKDDYDERSTLLHSRKFFSWYSSGFPGCHEFRKMVFATDDLEELWGKSREFFRKSAAQRDLAFLNQPFLMGGHG